VVDKREENKTKVCVSQRKSMGETRREGSGNGGMRRETEALERRGKSMSEADRKVGRRSAGGERS
jgi:hypothetical protein